MAMGTARLSIHNAYHHLIHLSLDTSVKTSPSGGNFEQICYCYGYLIKALTLVCCHGEGRSNPTLQQNLLNRYGTSRNGSSWNMGCSLYSISVPPAKSRFRVRADRAHESAQNAALDSEMPGLDEH
ncbi:hypothetical protein EJB05_06204, partial [Eragrostis curvula]